MTGNRPAALRSPGAIYASGLLGMGYSDLYIFLIPLYALSLGMSAAEVGALAGARHILAFFLSIHVGVSMDRFGTRRVTLFFVWTAIAMAPLFPLLPWFWPLLLLQMVNGGALSFAWSGSQTLIAQLADGEAEYIGRFSFFSRIGTTIAPIVVGLVWDFGGAWPAYLLGIAWGLLLSVALLRAPEAEIAPRGGESGLRPPRFRARDALPRLSDYVGCFALLAIPAVVATMAIMLLRNATNGVQFSLYVVYLDGIGLTGTVDRHTLCGGRDRERLRFALRWPGDAPGGPAAHDAYRHRAVDPVHLRDPVPWRHFCSAAPGAGWARLAAGRRAADHVFGAGKSGWPLPPGIGRWVAPDDQSPVLDHHSAGNGGDRRLVGYDRELCRTWCFPVAALLADPPAH